MSQRAMALAVRDFLRQHFEWSELDCEVVPPPGRPHPMAGELFIGVTEGGVDNQATESRYDVHRINVVISRRLPYSPQDRWADDVIHEAIMGLEVEADKVASVLHTWQYAYQVMDMANARIVQLFRNANVYGFTEPLRYLGTSVTEERGGDWFSADPGARAQGQIITVYFGKALRLQSLALQR